MARIDEQPLAVSDRRSVAYGALLLRAEHVAKRWPRAREAILDGLDLFLQRGELAWIAGRNGAGKTTLLRILAALIKPDAGGILLDGLDPERDRRAYQRRIALLSAGNSGLYARLSVAQHLQYWAKVAFVANPRVPAAIDDALDRFELRPLAGQRVDRLSLGQRQRLRLALAFVHKPQLILLDEPTTSLDEAGIAVLTHAVRMALDEGSTVVWCAPSLGRVGTARETHYTVEAGRLHAA